MVPTGDLQIGRQFAACLGTGFDQAGFELCRGRSGSELCLVCACTLPEVQGCVAALCVCNASFHRGKLALHGCVWLEVGKLSGFCRFH